MSTDPQPQARLFCRGGRLKGTTFNIQGAAVLGSDPNCQCRVDDPSVAAQHARLRWDADQDRFVLENLDSGQGTAVDGAMVRGERALDRLHVITLGDVSFVYQRTEVASVSPPPSPKTERLDSVPTIPVGLLAMEGRAEEPRWVLEVEIDGEWLRFDLSEGENRVGRVAADVVLPSREVSRNHALILVSGREVRIRDLGSTNFTFLNGERLLVETRVPLGGKLAFGPHPARIVAENN